jgi:hypothetical protein
MPAAVAIGTLRLRGAAADTPALRLRAARELAGADLAPPGLAPAAVLVVRRLADPLPRRLAAGEARVRPDPAWERAVRERLAAAARTAARPDGRGALAADAGAVLFADPAELLACAVRERVHGRLGERWWWRAVRRRLAVAATAEPGAGSDPAPLLAARPGETPAALAQLVRWGEAAAVAAALSPAGAARVLASLAAEHGLAPEVAGVAGGVGEGGWSGGVGGAEASEVGAGEGAAGGRTVGAWPPEPWRVWLPAELAARPLAPAVRCLFGVALGLAAAPQRLRAPAVARQARRWWRAVAVGGGPMGPSEPPAVVASPPAAVREAMPEAGAVALFPGTTAAADGASRALVEIRGPAAEDGAPAAAATAASHRPAPGAAPEPSSAASSTAPGSERRGDAGEVGEAVQMAAGEPEAARRRGRGSSTAAPQGSALAPRERSAVAAPVDQGPTTEARPEGETAAPAAPEPESGRAFGVGGIPTRIGGVLYLLHLLLDLGLPEVGERGWRLASTAGPWGTLELLARGLLGERFPRDPLWRALGELAGWPADAPRPRPSPPAYRVPASWPRKLADLGDLFLWSAARGRLRLWSAAGYLLAEVPRDGGPPSRQARRELARLGLGRSQARGGRPGQGATAPSTLPRLRRARAAAAPLAAVPPLRPGCPPLLGRWLAAALPAVRRRLLLALVGGGPALARAQSAVPGGPRDPVARALAVAGRLHVSASHLDLVLSLAAADLTVRRAGLDRDPGWLPACGRVVSFHFD